MKRSDYITWDEYFMGLALLSSRRSKDPSTQVGACIVNTQNRIMSVGYNGMPSGCSDDEFPWEREGEDNKYLYVCHAELNAILNSGGRNLQDCRIYTALFPCNNCAKAIIQSGIREVCYLSDKYADKPEFIAARRMFTAAGITLRKLELEHEDIRLDLREEGV
ncbi:MAG: dCMP deaminase family protein [Oscillospiraceae bacterium]|jgi:dCMP deaminase|nr:dCMP deaminase family protein [Oscillospiraceae bacterium]